MSIKLGTSAYIGVGLESSAGTAVVASKYIPFVTCTIKGVQEPLFDESGKGVREKNFGAITGKKHGEGDLEIYIDAENAPYLLYPALGSISSSTASGETLVFEHTITRKNTNPPKTLTVIYNDSVDTRKYRYGTINTAELNVSDGLATLSTNILSKSPSSGTATQAITAERILAFKDYTIKLGSSTTGTLALAAAASATATPVRSFKLNINNNAEAHYLSGDQDAAHIAVGQLEITGEFVLFYETTTERVFYETMLDGASPIRAMIVSFTGDSIGSAETEEIEIRIPNFKVNDRTTDAGVGSFITETVSFTAMYDVDEAKSIQLKVTNTTASY